jgi:hypothetical protein
LGYNLFDRMADKGWSGPGEDSFVFDTVAEDEGGKSSVPIISHDPVPEVVVTPTAAVGEATEADAPVTDIETVPDTVTFEKNDVSVAALIASEGLLGFHTPYYPAVEAYDYGLSAGDAFHFDYTTPEFTSSEPTAFEDFDSVADTVVPDVVVLDVPTVTPELVTPVHFDAFLAFRFHHGDNWL